MENLTIEVAQWVAINQLSNRPIPVTFQVKTGSMIPLIRPNLDVVTVMPAKQPPVAGDLVLFEKHDSQDGAPVYCLHRVRRVSRDGESLITQGDNCPNPDPAIPFSAVVGIATAVRRGHRTIALNTKAGRRAFLFQRTRQRLYQKIRLHL